MSIRFGRFELDEGRRQLLRDGAPLPLPAKQFLLLTFLIERRPNAISRRELYDHLWPATFVSDTNLASLVSDLRKTLGDDGGNSRWIRTVHRFGYAFVGEVVDAAAEPDERIVAILTGDGYEFHLEAGPSLVGRARAARCRITDASVSRKHAVITCSHDSILVRDLGSKNGTFVGPRRLEGDQELMAGDVVTFGSVRLVVRRPSEGSTITVAREQE